MSPRFALRDYYLDSVVGALRRRNGMTAVLVYRHQHDPRITNHDTDTYYLLSDFGSAAPLLSLFLFYNSRMLEKIALWTDDSRWRGILSDLGASISPRGVRFPNPAKKLSVPELADYADALLERRISELGAKGLSDAERRLLLLLPANARELRPLMGYGEGSATHTIETIVYNIRKKLGNDFIKSEDGEYRL
jgi:hypothetical protein